MKKTILFFAVTALLVQNAARADVIMKQKHHTDAFQLMGKTQPAKDAEETTWIAKDRVRSDREDMSVILRLDKKVAWMINNQRKTYTEVPLDADKIAPPPPPEGAEPGTDQMPNMQQMMKNMKFNIKMTVTPTDETMKINSWKCRKYMQTLDTGMSKTESVIWASEDIKIDPELYLKLNSALLSITPGFRESLEDLTKEAKKIKGVYVRTESATTIMGNAIKSTTELIEIKEGSAPAGIFDPPAGYTKEKMEDMMNARHQR